MAQLAICVFLVGAVFGLRFRVMVLLPFMLSMGAIALLIALMLPLTLLESLEDFAICAVTVQAGYLFGSLTRFAIAASRATRVLPRPLKTAR